MYLLNFKCVANLANFASFRLTGLSTEKFLEKKIRQVCLIFFSTVYKCHLLFIFTFPLLSPETDCASSETSSTFESFFFTVVI